MGRTEIGVRQFGNTVTIPADPRAKLMYYLDCICVVLDLSDTQNLSRLRDFRNYYMLTEPEVDTLIALTFLLSPDELNGKVIFCDEEMCGNNNNTFFELSAVQSNLLVSNSIVIGGQRRSVKKIMAYKRQWLVENWQNPMLSFTERLARIATGQPTTPHRPAIAYHSANYQTPRYYQEQRYGNYSSNSDSCCCTIL